MSDISIPIPKRSWLLPGSAQLLLCCYLQLLDLLTTLAFLMAGVAEGNPIARYAMQAAASPLVGLLLVKTLALALAVVCWWQQKLRLLSRINFFYALLIVWNLFCLILGIAFPELSR
jgi:hypothetical protein